MQRARGIAALLPVVSQPLFRRVLVLMMVGALAGCSSTALANIERVPQPSSAPSVQVASDGVPVIGGDAAVPPAVPGMPQVTVEDHLADGSFAIYWTPPLDSGSAPVTSFRVSYLEPGSTTWKDLPVVTADGSRQYSQRMHVAAFGKYSFKIVAVNNVGAGEPYLLSDVELK
jgi:hypothetical protein